MLNLSKIDHKNVVLYGFGITGKWLSSITKTKFIVDTDIKKWGDSFNGVSVVSPSSLSELDPNNDLVVVTVVDIFDVIPLLNHYGVNWVSLAEIINTEQISIENNTTKESDEFLKYSIDTVLKCQRAFLSENSFYLRSVDLVITEKCTLKCRDCANLMQFYETPIDYTAADVVAGIKSLSKNADFIHEVRIIGGEPFLNKNIYDIIDEVSLIENINRIVIYTNGMIPPKEERLEKFRASKLLFSITDYAELGRNLAKTIEVVKKFGIPYRVHPPEHWTDSGRLVDEVNDIEEAKSLFAKCCGKNLYTLIGPKLYRCPFAANADQLKAIPEHSSNYVYASEQKPMLKEFSYGIDFIDACRFCPGRSFDSPIITPAIQSKKPIPYKKYIKIDTLN
jgi:organic radical activating enzyme